MPGFFIYTISLDPLIIPMIESLPFLLENRPKVSRAEPKSDPTYYMQLAGWMVAHP